MRCRFVSTCLMSKNVDCTIKTIRQFHLCRVLMSKIVPFQLSDIGEGIAEVQIKEWFVKTGDSVKEFDNLCEVQSDKASVTITSRYAGVVKQLHFNIDEIAKVGQTLVDIETETTQDEQALLATDESVAVISEENIKPSATGTEEIFATPAVRRIAKEYRVNLADVKGTGADGRILKEDVLKFVGVSSTQDAVSKRGLPICQKEYSASARVEVEDKVVPIRGYMRIMQKTMSATTQIPHFGYGDEICMDRLVDLRDQLKSIATDLGIKMSYMPLFIKAASLALKQFPVLNSTLGSDLETLTYKAAHNICIAMDTKDGLVVPNVKNCESKNLWQIAKELNRLHEAGLKGQLSKDDISDGTFTLSNIGSIGGTYASPVIFPPQVVIGALGRIQIVPRFDNENKIQPTRIVYVSWSADHRVIDGATMARFCNLWKQYLENPAVMIAEMS